MNALAKYFKDINYMNLLAYDRKLLKKYNVIWNKISSLFKKEFCSEPVHKDKQIRTKVNLYNTPLLGKRVPKNECYAWASVFLPDSIVNVDKKYYPLVLSNECKYIVIKEKIRIMSAIVEELIINDFDDHDKLTKTKILS